VTWVEAFTVFLVCHSAGDFLLQTEFQAINKAGGLGSDPVARRALSSHLVTYTLIFVPAIVWIASEQSVGRAIGALAVLSLTHLVQDDQRLLRIYARRVKKTQAEAGSPLWIGIDQSAHLAWLFVAALVAAA
jgi:hypothetical protein